MIKQESREKMLRNHEASVRCTQGKFHNYNLQDSGNGNEGLPRIKDDIYSHCLVGPLDSENSLNNGTIASSNEGYHKPMYQQDFYTWSAFQNQWNNLESHFYQMGTREYHFPVENRIQYVPFRMFPQGYPPEIQFQEFQYFVVIDFEATCDKEKNPHPQEIIEFPSVLVNSMTGQLEGSFQTYVRPMYHQRLTDFCKELTGIQQIQVDRGVPLSEAFFMHDKWLDDKGVKNTNFAVVTWSNWDCRVMLESECRFKRIRKPPYFNRWINLKVPFNEVFGRVRCNLKEAVQLAGLSWEGRAHCGLDDARNTARLLAYIMRRGFRFSITNSLMWQSHDYPRTWQSPDRSNPAHYRLKQPTPIIQFHPITDISNEKRIHCFCGAKSCKRMVRKPGPNHGSFFFGCGNWTTSRGALCPYFEWASS